MRHWIQSSIAKEIYDDITWELSLFILLHFVNIRLIAYLSRPRKILLWNGIMQAEEQTEMLTSTTWMTKKR